MERGTETEIGVFPDAGHAEEAVRALSDSVAAERIGVIDDPRKAREVVGTRVGQLVVPGAIAGALAGVVLLLLVPGLENYKTSPVTLAPWAIVGALLGLVTGALVGKLLPRRDAGRYERRLERGGVLVAVHCSPNECAAVRRILARAGAENLGHEPTAESP